MAAAVVDRLTHRYGGGGRAALEEASLRVEPGLTLVAGESGGGKSTLLRVLNGLVPHFHGGRTAGRAVVAGLDVRRTPTRRLARHVGFVFQDPEAQFLGGSVEREVAFGPENLGMPAARMEEQVEEALALVGATQLRGRAVADLSGGERQRVAVAAALATRPEILVLDEPTSQLDAAGAAAVLDVCTALAARGLAVVLAEHRLDAALARAGALALVRAGRVEGPGDPRALAARLAAPPQVVALGRHAGWDPLPLVAAEAAAWLGAPPVLPEEPLPAGDVAWELRGVTAGPGRREVLAGVDAAGCSGEVVALVGPNGGGKTTLLRAVAGVLPVRGGTVRRRSGRVAYVPQNPAAVLHRATVRDEVTLTLRRCASTQPPEVMLSALGVRHLAERHPRDLSSGERQRVAVAALLAGDPVVALLDEPTRGMDAPARAALARVLRRLAAEGCAVVVATHDSELAAETADRVLEVRDGGVHDLGPVRRALTGTSPYATQIGSLRAGGPLTVAEALALL